MRWSRWVMVITIGGKRGVWLSHLTGSLISCCDPKWLLSGGHSLLSGKSSRMASPVLHAEGRGTGISLSGLDGWTQYSTVMQSMHATDTVCVIISVIQFYQPPPRKERRGRGWGKFTLGRWPRKQARCWPKISFKQCFLIGNLQDNWYYF